MSDLHKSFELNRMNIQGWMFSCPLISSYNRNMGKQGCPLSHPQLIPLNIMGGASPGRLWAHMNTKDGFFEVKKNASPI